MFVRQKTLNYLYGIESIMSGMTYVPFNHPSSSAPIAFNHSLLILIIPPPPQRSCRGVYWFHHVRPSVCKQILCRMIT